MAPAEPDARGAPPRPRGSACLPGLTPGAGLAARNPEVAGVLSAPVEAVRAELEQSAPFLLEHPRLSVAAAGGLGLAGALAYRRWRRTQGLERAIALTSAVSVTALY